MRTGRLAQSTTAVLLASTVGVLSLAILAAARAHAEPSSTWDAIPDHDVFALKVWLNDAGELNVLVGDALSFHFQSGADAHLIAIHIDTRP